MKHTFRWGSSWLLKERGDKELELTVLGSGPLLPGVCVWDLLRG